ncbi:uncharacterized protein zgc:92242 [Kryptolebias marmoratus]|uniref:Zgc:92242 n=1 Tax=Kryptolebias marmoratus TaxID=37003 RepID=A0A3Q3G4I8_KRYMA|nr:uncharacterized protein zgc:92242 [Kryptolebias marmoratus]
MLAKILEDMWVEPEVLEALSEAQKKILFLKMREEQVRRWREREEKELRDAGPKKVSTKRVTWLAGRDGDVSVSIIGEVDEFRSSKLLQNLNNNNNNNNNRVHRDGTNGIQTADLLPGREARGPSFKDPVTDANGGSASEEDVESCSTDDDPKDPSEDSGSESDQAGDCSLVCRPHPRSHGNPKLKAQLLGTERASQQDRATASRSKTPEQLQEAFAGEARKTAPASNKPPIPAKPAHLQRRSQD